jgi:hypothetical protein
MPEIAILSVCPKARKKLYIALAKGRLSLKAKACAAKPCALKSILKPILAIKERKI